jgi:hypothetical protein
MKKILLIAAVALISASVFAQTVQSANVVGYNTLELTQSAYNLVSTAFLATNSIDTIFGDLPTGTKISFWDAGTQGYTAVTKGRGGWGTGGTNVIERGAGVFILMPAGSDVDQVVSGDVPDDGSFTNFTVNGYALLSFPYTADVVFSNTAVFANSATGDKISFWNGSGYTSYTKGRGGWDVAVATNVIEIGSAFFYLTGAAGNEADTQPYTLD